MDKKSNRHMSKLKGVVGATILTAIIVLLCYAVVLSILLMLCGLILLCEAFPVVPGSVAVLSFVMLVKMVWTEVM